MNLKPKNGVIFDTDFIFSLLVVTDSNHASAQRLLTAMQEMALDMIVSNNVLQEAATLFSRRHNQQEAIRVIELLKSLDSVWYSQEDEHKIWDLFKSYTKKGVSFVDCSTVYFANKNNWYIASFDRFYPKDRLLPTYISQ